MKLPDTSDIDWQKFFWEYRFQILFSLLGFLLLGIGVFFFKSQESRSSGIEILNEEEAREVVVEVAGAVISPGVYQLETGARIEDALIAAGGFSEDADRIWTEKMINRAALVTDGQKIYIPNENQSDPVSASFLGTSDSISESQDALININNSTQKELESLWGIGPTYAQNIIEHRPYSSVEELLSKKIIKSNVYERNKDKLTVY